MFTLIIGMGIGLFVFCIKLMAGILYSIFVVAGGIGSALDKNEDSENNMVVETKDYAVYRKR